MAAKKYTRCPQAAMLEDLKTVIEQAKEEGDEIIVGGNFNMNVTTALTELCEHLELKNEITTQFETGGPPTYAGGIKQIDDILVSTTINVYQCGYPPLNLSPGDHRVIWLDINKT